MNTIKSIGRQAYFNQRKNLIFVISKTEIADLVCIQEVNSIDQEGKELMHKAFGIFFFLSKSHNLVPSFVLSTKEDKETKL